MPQTYDHIEVTEILSYEGAETAKIARYERIMQHRTIEAMNGLSNRMDTVVDKLDGVANTIYRTGQLAQDKANEAIFAGPANRFKQVAIGAAVRTAASRLEQVVGLGWNTQSRILRI